MMDFGKSTVTAQSSDEEIMNAIDAAGEHRYYWRRSDWPKEGSNNTKSWVKPGDIGLSTREDTSLLKRLKGMVASGLLEQRYVQVANSYKKNYGFQDTPVDRPMFPRFRVIRK